ncbi:CHAT domain-containing protein [Micromonospora sp. M12]
MTKQPWEVEPPLGHVVVLEPRLAVPGGRAGRAANHELLLDVVLNSASVTCRASLSGSALSERTARLPVGIAHVWDGLAAGDPVAVDQRLAHFGGQLREVLLDPSAVVRIERMVDRWQFGSTLDIVVVADEAPLGLPYELLRLSDGRLLCSLAGIRMRRRLRGCGHGVVMPLPGPLKVLVAVAAPEERRSSDPALAVEAEMQAVLDAVAPVAEDDAGQVTVLEVAGPGQIADALRAEQYHVLHLSAHGSATGVRLEDEDGDPVDVGADELVEALRAGQHPLPLIVLSSCRSGAGGSANLATALVRSGADRVLAMQAAVTDNYATDLARLFYKALAGNASTTPGQALADARRKLEEQRRVAKNRTPPEYGVPILLGAGEDQPLHDPRASAEPLAKPTPVPVGGTVRQLRIGELIGRRALIREAMAVLRGDPKAVARFGAASGWC